MHARARHGQRARDGAERGGELAVGAADDVEHADRGHLERRAAQGQPEHRAQVLLVLVGERGVQRVVPWLG